MPAFIETLAQGADPDPSVGVRVPKGIPHPLDQGSDFLSLRFGIGPQCSQQIGIESNLQSLFRCLHQKSGLCGF
jgi:hypothetical protein